MFGSPYFCIVTTIFDENEMRNCEEKKKRLYAILQYSFYASPTTRDGIILLVQHMLSSYLPNE